MTTKMTFGDCLKYLLTTFDISFKKLSRAINVDSSLISRWIHGKRIPAYDTVYIENIADYLSKNVTNSFQIKLLNDLYANLCADKDIIDNNAEKISKVLLEAQGYSIECKKKEDEKSRNNIKSKKALWKTEESSLDNNIRENIKMDQLEKRNLISYNSTVSLSRNDKIIYGTNNILKVIILLLETAVLEKKNDNNIIYFTFNNDFNNIFTSNNMLFIKLRNALLKTIESGWNVIFIIRINNNIERIMKFTDYIFPLIHTGKVNIYYLNKYDLFTLEKELCIVSGLGVLSCFPFGENELANCSFYINTKAGVDIFSNYIKSILKCHAIKLLKFYYKNMEEDFYNAITELYEKPGNQLNYNSNFSLFLLPEELYKKLLIKNNYSANEILLSLYYYRKLLNGFKKNIQNYKYIDICLAESIEQLVNHKILYLHSCNDVKIVDLEKQDIIDYIQNIIHFIQAYDNYEIAVIFNTSDNYIQNNASNYIVKERQAVFINVINSLKGKSGLKISIEEPMLVKAFVENYHEMWDKIAPINKDKKENIAWLQDYLDCLK